VQPRSLWIGISLGRRLLHRLGLTACASEASKKLASCQAVMQPDSRRDRARNSEGHAQGSRMVSS
jgi:hypothetical protein